MSRAPAVSSLSFTGPITAIHWVQTSQQPQIQSDRFLLVARAGALLLFDTKGSHGNHHHPQQKQQQQSLHKQSLKVVNKDRIHVIGSLASDHHPGQVHIVLGAGRQLVHAILHLDKLSLEVKSRRLLDDFVLAVSFYQNPETRQPCALAATSHHSVYLLALDSHDFDVLQRRDCQDRPFLWSAAFSRSCYQDLADVRLASGSVWADVLVWRPYRSSALDCTLTGHNGTIFGVAFSPSESTLASCSDDHTVRVWSLASPANSPVMFWGHQARVWRVSWISDRQLVSAGEDAKLLVWDALEQRQCGAWHDAHDGKSIWALTVQRDLGIVASGGADGQIRLLKHASLTSYTSPSPIDMQSKAVAASLDGKVAAALDKACVLHVQQSGQMRLLSGSKWIESNGSMISIIPHTDLLCILSPKGSGLLVSTSATSLNEGLLFELGHVCSQVQAQSVEGSGSRLLVSDPRAGEIKLYRLDGISQPELLATTPASKVASMRLTPSGKHLLLGCLSGQLVVSKLSKNERLQCPRVHEDAITCILPLSDSVFLTGSRDCTWATHEIQPGGHVVTLSRSCLRDGARIEKMALHQDRVFFLCAGQSKFHVLDQVGNKLASAVYSSATVPQTAFCVTDVGLAAVWQAKRGPSTLKVPLVASEQSFTNAPPLGQEVLDVKFFRPNPDLLLLAATTEDGAIHLASMGSESGALRALYADRSLRTAIKTLHWIKSDEGDPYLVGTGSRISRLVYKVHVFRDPQSSSAAPCWSAGAVMINEAVSQEGKEDDVRIVDSIVSWDSAKQQVAAICGCSDGSMRSLSLTPEAGASWMTEAQSAATRKCTLSVARVRSAHHCDYLAQGSTNGLITIWPCPPTDPPSNCWTPVTTFQAHDSGVNALAARSTDTQIMLASGGDDGQICVSVLDVHGPSQKPSLKRQMRGVAAHASAVRCVRFLDDATLVTGSWDQRLALWKVTDQGLELLRRVLTDVADMNAIDAVDRHPEAEAGQLLAVGGVGLHTFAIGSAPEASSAV